MDLKQLEYFVRVAELGSFTRAAQALDVAQPALSRQVRLLEVELRQNLLLRNGRGAMPTEAGRLLLEHAGGFFTRWSGPAKSWGAWAVRWLAAWPLACHRACPGRWRCRSHAQCVSSFRRPACRSAKGLSINMQEWLTSGRLDIAVLYNAQPNPDIELTPLLEEELVLVQPRPAGLAQDPPPGPIALKDIAQLPLVIPSRPNALRMLVESEMANLGLRPTGGSGNRWRGSHS